MEVGRTCGKKRRGKVDKAIAELATPKPPNAAKDILRCDGRMILENMLEKTGCNRPNDEMNGIQRRRPTFRSGRAWARRRRRRRTIKITYFIVILNKTGVLQQQVIIYKQKMANSLTKKLKVYIFGGSTVKGLSGNMFKRHDVTIRGVGGAKINEQVTRDIVEEVNLAVRTAKVVVILHYGTNNIGCRNPNARQTVEEFCSNLRHCVNCLSEIIGVGVIVRTILPRPLDCSVMLEKVKTANKMMLLMCKEFGNNVVIGNVHKPFLKMCNSKNNVVTNLETFATDMFHLNDMGKLILTEVFENLIHSVAVKE